MQVIIQYSLGSMLYNFPLTGQVVYFSRQRAKGFLDHLLFQDDRQDGPITKFRLLKLPLLLTKS